MAFHHTVATAIAAVALGIVRMTAAYSAVAPALLPRQTNAPDLVDPVTQPFCESSSCWHWDRAPDSPSPDICPLVDGPCPSDGASDNGGNKCGMHQYHRDCYCSLKTGLNCAWSCSWTVWWETENWFASLCPDSPALKLDFSGLPKCARGCLDDATFGYGCLTQSSNCFCSHGSLFDCHNNCHSQDEWQQIETWLQDACDVSPDIAKQAIDSGTFTLGLATASARAAATETKSLSPPPATPPKPLSWTRISSLPFSPSRPWQDLVFASSAVAQGGGESASLRGGEPEINKSVVLAVACNIIARTRCSLSQISLLRVRGLAGGQPMWSCRSRHPRDRHGLGIFSGHDEPLKRLLLFDDVAGQFLQNSLLGLLNGPGSLSQKCTSVTASSNEE